ncbi:hypothetical protein [Halobacteriovorax sp. RT-2-6]
MKKHLEPNVAISLNNSDYRRYLDKVVRNLQLIFKNQEDHNFIRMLIQENKDVYSCIQKLEDPNIYKSMIDKHLHTLNYNSKKRLEFYYTIKYIYQEDYENGSFDCEGV